MKPSPASPSPVKAGELRVYALVCFTVFLDLLGLGIIIPIQPFYVESFGASPSTVTMLGAAYALMQFLFVPVWGRLSDRVGRRPIILTSVAASVVGWTLFGLAESLWLVFAARMMSGFGNANIATAQAALADITTQQERAKAMGFVGASIGLGFILGPAAGGLLSQTEQWGPLLPIYAAAALSLVNWILALLFFPETLPPEKRSRESKSPAGFSLQRYRESKAWPGVPRLLVLMLVMATASTIMEHSIGLWLERVWLWDGGVQPDPSKLPEVHRQAAILTAYVLLTFGIVTVIIQGGLVGHLVRRFGEVKLILVGLLLIASALSAIPMCAGLGVASIFPVFGLMAIGSAITDPSISSLLSRSVPDTDQGRALGLGRSMASLGRVIGPSTAGFLLELRWGLPFGVAAALMLVALLVALKLRRVRPTTPVEPNEPAKDHRPAHGD